MTNKNPNQLETSLALNFNDKLLLKEALTHKSFLNENRHLPTKSYERLEFLGDAVLELWVSDTLFRKFPDFPEGKLTNLRALSVQTMTLSEVAQNLNIGDYVYLSQGEERGGGRQNLSILEDAFEALIGAIYIDQGQTQAFEFLKRFLLPTIIKLSKQKIYKDSKSIFQEIAQAKTGITPHYQTIDEAGPDHAKTFTVAVFLDDKKIATGRGLSKQKAEDAASKKAIKVIEQTQSS